MPTELPPFGEGRIAARLEREQELFDKMAEQYATWRSNLFRKIIAIDVARQQANHDPGDEDRSER